MNPTKWPLMTPSEMHAFGIEIIRPYLEKEGFTVQAVNNDPSSQPQILGQRWRSPACVYVRTAMYPNKGWLTPSEVEHALTWAAQKGATPFFASVGLACCNLPDRSETQSDAQMRLPIKNGGFHVAYNGALLITTSEFLSGSPESPPQHGT